MKNNITNFSDFNNMLQQEHIFEQFNLEKIGVFGSFSRGEQFNDIDIFIEEEISDEQLILLKITLENRVGVPVDIMLKKYADPLILFRAEKDIKYATKH